MNLLAQRTRRLLNIFQLQLIRCVVGVEEHADQSSRRNEFVQETKPLSLHLANEKIYPRRVAAGSVKAGYETKVDRVHAAAEDNRNGRGCRLRSDRRIGGTCRSDNVHSTPNQIGNKRRQSVVLALCPAVLDRHVLAFHVSAFIEALMECCQRISGVAGRPTAEESDHRHRRLLCARRERPCHGSAANQGDELAPPHACSPLSEDCTLPHHCWKCRVVHHSILAHPTSATGQNRTTSFGLACPLPPRADIGQPEQSVGQAVTFCFSSAPGVLDPGSRADGARPG